MYTETERTTEPRDVNDVIAETMATLKGSPITFYNYIAERVQREEYDDDPAGDFMLDAEADSFFPRNITANNAGFVSAFQYLYYNRHACEEAMSAFYECWEEYFKIATGRAWIDPGSNAR